MIPLHDDNPAQTPPVITVVIIVACVLAFFWELSLGERLKEAVLGLGVVPAVLTGNRQLAPELVRVAPPLTLLTSMFLHGGWMHLLGNMLYLWIFGNNVEDAMGHARFVVFYLVCGVIAVLAHVLPATGSVVPLIGASGAISGVLGAYLLLYPHARVLVAIPIGFVVQTVSLKAGWVLGFWFVLQIVNSLAAGKAQGGVAFAAHVGGFVAGVVLLPVFRRRGVGLLQPARKRRPPRRGRRGL